jgi:hypothetical protein
MSGSSFEALPLVNLRLRWARMKLTLMFYRRQIHHPREICVGRKSGVIRQRR